MMEQYAAIKSRHQNMILLFRVGDFYETFYDDARTIASELNIVLTSRGRESETGDEIPLAGVPHHSVDNYISRLIRKGYKVAICDQVEDPKEAKGTVVERDVTRIITPGTLTESDYLEEGSNNYLAAINHKNGIFGLSYIDVSTSDFFVCEYSSATARQDLFDEVSRIRAAEVLLCEELYMDPDFTGDLVRHLGRSPALGQFEAAFPQEAGDAARTLCEHFGTATLEGFGVSGRTHAVSTVAAAAALLYLKLTQKNDLRHLRSLSPRLESRFMHLDVQSRLSLDIAPSLFSVLNFSKTAMGARTLRNYLENPLCDPSVISWRQDMIAEFRSSRLSRDVKDVLGEVYDIERIMARVSVRSANPRDIVALRISLAGSEKLGRLFAASTDSPVLREYYSKVADFSELVSHLDGAIVDDPPVSLRDGGIFRPGFDGRLDDIVKIARGGKEWLLGFEQREQKRTGIKSLKVKYNRIFGYFIEVTKSNLELIPPDYIRKQTMAGAERFYTPELKDMENQIINADEEQKKYEYELFQRLLDRIAAVSEAIYECARTIAAVDAVLSLAEASIKYNYCRPQVDEGGEIEIAEGRHPVVENRMTYSGFIPNDTKLGGKHAHVQILTGPNMAGKSTYIRQVALIVLMAQAGSYVPAKSARIGICDRIFTRIGASDNLAAGQSTFMVEMIETANILNNATPRSLMILDEIGRGTSTYDGLAIAYAVIEYILGGGGKLLDGARTLFATHYHELTVLDKTYDKVQNLNVAISDSESGIVFLHRIVAGPATRSYGIHVARIAGLPDQVIKRASDILGGLEESDEKNNVSRLIKTAARARARKDDGNQLDLFEAPAPPRLPAEALEIIRKIKETDINTCTPLEALVRLGGLLEIASRLEGEL